MADYQSVSVNASPTVASKSNNPQQPLIHKSSYPVDDKLAFPQRKNRRKTGCQRSIHGCGKKCKRCCSCFNWSLIGNTTYDLINIFITIADIITDSLVTYNFYENNQMTFFWISLSIVIIAQVSYAFTFAIKYVESNSNHCAKSLFWFIIGLIFSPIMSFIFFLTSNRERCLGKIFFEKFDLYVPGESSIQQYSYSYSNRPGYHDMKADYNEKTRITEWIEIKFQKHIGFIIESAFEAFPQVLFSEY